MTGIDQSEAGSQGLPLNLPREFRGSVIWAVICCLSRSCSELGLVWKSWNCVPVPQAKDYPDSPFCWPMTKLFDPTKFFIENKTEQIFGLVFKTSALHISVPGFGSWLWLLITNPGKQQVMAQAVELLWPMWESWTEFWGFLLRPWLSLGIVDIWGVKQQMAALSVWFSVSIILSNKMI